MNVKEYNVKTIIECDEGSVLYHKIETIKISDDGDGVPLSEFDESIMQIATEKKDGGMGVGRFGALQIGRVMTIETCAFDEKENKHTVTSLRSTPEKAATELISV